MANQIRMTPATMRTRASQTDKQAETVQNVITTMDKLLKTLKTEWEGDAMKGYEERYNKIKPSFKNAKELLDEIAHNLREQQRLSKKPTRISQTSSESNFLHVEAAAGCCLYKHQSAVAEMCKKGNNLKIIILENSCSKCS